MFDVISLLLLILRYTFYFNLLIFFQSIIRCPVLYFDKNPTGNILNRFTSDVGMLDIQLPFILNDCIEGPAIFLNLIITICIFNPLIIIPAIFEIALLLFWYNWSKPIISELKKIDLIYKSPVFAHFASTISGILQINVYNKKKDFNLKMNKLTEDNLKTSKIE